MSAKYVFSIYPSENDVDISVSPDNIPAIVREWVNKYNLQSRETRGYSRGASIAIANAERDLMYAGDRDDRDEFFDKLDNMPSYPRLRYSSSNPDAVKEMHKISQIKIFGFGRFIPNMRAFLISRGYSEQAIDEYINAEIED